MSRHALPLLAALPLLFVAGHAAAQENADRFTLRLGAMNADASTTFSARTEFMGQPYEFSEKFDFGSDEIVPRIDGVFRLSERQRLVFDYFNYKKDRREELGSDVSYDDITIPAGSFAKADMKFELASLLYDYSVVNTETVSVGLQIGAEWARVKGSVYAEAGDDTWRDSAQENGYAPVVGVRLTATPSEHWLFNLQGQYLDAGWGDFGDYDGSISRANAIAEYRFTRSFGLFAGYEWYRLDVKRTGGDGIVGWDQRFKGPVVGVTLAF